MRSFSSRVVGACRLDVRVFEEVEADTSATSQAVVVVLLTGLAGGLGSMGQFGTGLGGVLGGAAVGVAAWIAWASITFGIGTRVLPEPQTDADTGQLLRVLAFSAAPGLLQVLGVFSAVRMPVFLVSSLWMLAAMVVAVRQALDYRSTSRAAAVCVFGWALVLLLALALGIVFPVDVS